MGRRLEVEAKEVVVGRSWLGGGHPTGSSSWLHYITVTPQIAGGVLPCTCLVTYVPEIAAAVNTTWSDNLLEGLTNKQRVNKLTKNSKQTNST